ncbi:toll/interleukin-1 receptor domain-containing protein [Streptomyces sp. NPDC050315]|uniref:toll/interleukin-1 receptor domain-containing protein n=1 Tax=Streptomyces sp. NPDC050315 TaxID=3155039 RepID=UPI0034364847
MPEIFINYRTRGGKDAAYRFYEYLTQRFGEGAAFLAAKSIPLGHNYADVLDESVRRSSALLALVHHDWLDSPDRRRPERRALTDPKDWVRRELEEAFDWGVLVVPVLLERQTDQLDPRRLPRSIAQLAECQLERFSLRTAESDLARIGDRLAQQVPDLAARERNGKETTATTPQADTIVRNTGQSGGMGGLRGTVGTFVNESHGSLHTGSGDQVAGDKVGSVEINGDGTNYNTRGPIRQEFGVPRHPRDGER